jgi:hypothetical protein
LHHLWDKDHYNALKAASAGDDHEGDEITAEDEDDNGAEVSGSMRVWAMWRADRRCEGALRG